MMDFRCSSPTVILFYPNLKHVLCKIVGFFFKYNNILMTKDIFIFYLTLIFFPFQENPAKERMKLSIIIKTKKQYIIY